MRILFVSSVIPWPPNVGTILRSLSLIESLEKSAQVDFLFFSHNDSVLRSEFAVNRNILGVFQRPDFLKRIGWSHLQRWFRLGRNDWLPYYFPYFYKAIKADSGVIRSFYNLHPEKYDLLFFVQFEPFWWLGCPYPEKVVLDIDMIKHTGVVINDEIKSSPLKQAFRRLLRNNLRKAEEAGVHKVGIALVCSHDDKKIFQDRTNIRIVPNVFPRHKEVIAENPIQEKTILFVGTLTYKSNLKGLEFFIRKVLPIIRDVDPDVTLTVVGSTDPRTIYGWQDDPGVACIGTVQDTAPYFRAANFSICPMLDGTGTRIKIIESLSFAKVVVSTTIGAYGIDIFQDSGLFRVDNTVEMAKLCLKLLQNKEYCSSLGARGRDEVLRRYSQEFVDSQIDDAIRSLLHKPSEAGVRQPLNSGT